MHAESDMKAWRWTASSRPWQGMAQVMGRRSTVFQIVRLVRLMASRSLFCVCPMTAQLRGTRGAHCTATKLRRMMVPRSRRGVTGRGMKRDHHDDLFSLEGEEEGEVTEVDGPDGTEEEGGDDDEEKEEEVEVEEEKEEEEEEGMFSIVREYMAVVSCTTNMPHLACTMDGRPR